MVKIDYALFRGNYRILWLRYIDGVNLNVHCMRSLLGHNDPRVNSAVREMTNLELEDAPFYYLCGVDENFVWDKNLHLAFMHAHGEEVFINDRFIKCRIRNARQLPITDSYIDQKLPQARDARFYTCRNWQFANFLAATTDLKRSPLESPPAISI